MIAVNRAYASNPYSNLRDWDNPGFTGEQDSPAVTAVQSAARAMESPSPDQPDSPAVTAVRSAADAMESPSPDQPDSPAVMAVQSAAQDLISLSPLAQSIGPR